MVRPLDLAYLSCASSLLRRGWRTGRSRDGRYRRGIGKRFFGWAALPPPKRPRAWFHGVSVGEVHLLRQVIAAFRERRPDWECVVSTSTDTGLDEAERRFPDLPVIAWPFDFSWAVKRAVADRAAEIARSRRGRALAEHAAGVQESRHSRGGGQRPIQSALGPPLSPLQCARPDPCCIRCRSSPCKPIATPIRCGASAWRRPISR